MTESKARPTAPEIVESWLGNDHHQGEREATRDKALVASWATFATSKVCAFARLGRTSPVETSGGARRARRRRVSLDVYPPNFPAFAFVTNAVPVSTFFGTFLPFTAL